MTAPLDDATPALAREQLLTNPDLRKMDVLDHIGHVRLVEWMGSDLSVVRSARVSFNAEWRAGEDAVNDRRLLRRLWSGKPYGDTTPLPLTPAHSTPFEACYATFDVMLPIFVVRQWHRHRTQSYNEVSARYTEMEDRFYLPDPALVGVQSTSNKQGSVVTGHDPLLTQQRAMEVEMVKRHQENSYALYKTLLGKGWPREKARIVLTFALHTHMFASANLLNWIRFLNLRCDPDAQYEIREYADRIAIFLSALYPEVMRLWFEAHEPK